jgi:hypothetical protein
MATELHPPVLPGENLMPSHPFASGNPPSIPSGNARQRADTYIHGFPDHWGKKPQLKALRDQLRLSVFGLGADTSAVEVELAALLDLLDGLYLLHPWGPPSPDNPWQAVERPA